MKATNIALATISLMAASCTAPIDIDTTDSPPVVCIYGCFTSELKRQSVRVSVSSPYFAAQPNQPVRGAQVRINVSNGDEYILVENPDTLGLYQTETAVSGIVGETYTLVVKTDAVGGAGQYTAVSTMPALYAVDSISVKSETMMGHTLYKLSLYAQDSQALSDEDYYLGICKVDGVLFDQISMQICLESMQMRYMSRDLLRFPTKEKEGDDNRDDDGGRRHIFVESGSEVVLYFSRIEKGYYDFLQQCSSGMGGESPFSGPAANISTNISGGVGYFAAYAVAEARAVAE